MTRRKRQRETTINDLPFKILIRIFMCLNPLDIITSACLVSKAWNQACYFPGIWETTDMNLIGVNWTTRSKEPVDVNADIIDGPRRTLVKILFRAMKFSAGNIRRLVFHSMTFLMNRDLINVAKCNPKLKHLVLPSGNLICQNGFEVALMHWKDLESLTLPRSYFRRDMMRIIGDHCKSFTELKMTCPLSLEFAQGIVQHVPWLKSLSLRFTRFEKRGLAHLLKNLEHLEFLSLLHSHMEYHIICNDSDVPELSDEAMIRKLSQIKTVVMCQNMFYSEVCKCKSKYQDLLAWNHE